VGGNAKEIPTVVHRGPSGSFSGTVWLHPLDGGLEIGLKRAVTRELAAHFGQQRVCFCVLAAFSQHFRTGYS
jgi:hypothetical protein